MTKQKTKSTAKAPVPPATNSSELIQAIEGLQSKIRIFTLKRDFTNDSLTKKVAEFSESNKGKELSKEQILNWLDKISEPWRSEKAEMSEDLRIAAEIARDLELRTPGCLLLAELLISHSLEITAANCVTANAELQELAIAVRSKSVDSGRKKKGRRRDPEKTKALETIKNNPNCSTAEHRELLAKQGIDYGDKQVHKLRNEAKNLPK